MLIIEDTKRGNVVYQYLALINTLRFSPTFPTHQLYNVLSLQPRMSEQSKEAHIILTIKALRENPKLKCKVVARSFRVPESTLHSRINGHLTLSERRLAMQKMTDLEEQVILKRILDLDSRGFAPQIAGVEDMANFILKSQGKERVGQHWARRFI
jgi:hypothetical protein